MVKASEIFGELTFNKKVMKDKLSKEIFKKLMETVLPEEKTIVVPIIAEVQAGDNWGEMEKI